MNALKIADPEIYQAIQDEIKRQEYGLEMIASENYCSKAVLEASGCVMTNKYAEGYPGRRYYGGCEYVDVAEDLARDRAKALFGAEHANVQPHSGSQANMGVYYAVLKPGDTILSMNLAQGGHLTHGHDINFSGQTYDIVCYPVSRETEMIDYDEMARLAKEHKPNLIVCGASAYPRTIDFARIKEIADSVEAMLMADIAHIAGMVATGLHPNPVPHCDFVTTTTHKTLRGPRGGMIFCKEKYAADIDRTIMPGIQGGPLMHVIAAKAVCFKEAATDDFIESQKRTVQNASILGSALVEKGFRLCTGGTDNHLLLVDLNSKGFSGKKAESRLGKAGITVNRNLIPYDKRKPMITSGIRIGTPAISTRGMGKAEMLMIADWIDRVLVNPDEKPDDVALTAIADEVMQLCRKFPVYGELID